MGLYVVKHENKKAAKSHKKKIEARGGNIIADKMIGKEEVIHYNFPPKPKAKKKATKKRK